MIILPGAGRVPAHTQACYLTGSAPLTLDCRVGGQGGTGGVPTIQEPYRGLPRYL